MEIDSVEALQAELHLLRQENLRLRSSPPEHDPRPPENDGLEQVLGHYIHPIADGLGEGLLLVDLDDVVLYVNRRMVELTGYDSEELIGGPAYERLLSPAEWYALLDRMQENGPAHRERYELEMIRKDGSTLIGEIRATPWRNAKGMVIGVIGAIADVTDRQRALNSLRQSEARYRQMFERNRAIKLLIDPQTLKILDANTAACEFYGYSLETLCGMLITQINTLPADVLREDFLRVVEGSRHVFNFRHRLASGVVKEVEVHSGPVDIDTRTCLYSIVHDVTERKRLQEQSLLRQKMESVGRLAGGIAHDFNNLLTAILGYTNLAQTDTEPGSDMDVFHKKIQKAAERASELTHQLLAFAQRTTVEPQRFDIHAHILRMEDRLRELLRDDIELVITPGEAPTEVYADPMTIEQILGTLVDNGRDALPSGGKLTVTAGSVVVSEEEARDKGDLPAGEYVRIDVEDNGIGMSEEIKSRVFDPFFTTKPQGQGTGLGLAMCYGVITQSAGTIRVDSAEGVGTRFTVLLPAAPKIESKRAEHVRESAPKPLQIRTGGRETILLVEDDVTVRNVTARGLRDQGYNVLEAGHGREALQVADAYQDTIDLLITDVIMPQMGGKELSAHLQKRRPETKVLYISGYTDNAIVRRGILEKGLSFLQKPFTADMLAEQIQEILPVPG